MVKYIGDYIIYARVSSPKQTSIGNQVTICHQYAKKNIKGELIKVLHDKGSGRNLNNLSNLNILQKTVSQNKNCHIIITEINRLGRSSFDSQLLLKTLTNIATIHSVSDDIIVGVNGRLLDINKSIKLVDQAVAFSESLSNRVKASYKMKIEDGQDVRQKVPYGFKFQYIYHKKQERKYLVKDPSTYDKYKNIYRSKVFRKSYNLTPKEFYKIKTDWNKNVRLAKIGEHKVELLNNQKNKPVDELSKILENLNLSN